MLNLLYPRCYGNIQPDTLWDSDGRFGEGLWFYETVDGWEILHLVASWLVVFPNIYRFFLHLRCYVRFCSQFKFTLHLLQNMCQVWAWRDLKLADHPNPAAILIFATSISFSDVKVFRIFQLANCPSSIFCRSSQCWKSSRNETYPLWFKRFALFFSFVTSHWFNPLSNNLWFRGSFGARDSVKDGKAQHLDFW